MRCDMSAQSQITCVIAVNNRDLFEQNFLASPCLRQLGDHQLLVQEKFRSAAKAYNDAIDRAQSDLIVFCHQDVLLPDTWPSQFQSALDYLALSVPKWGVLG